MTRIHRSLIIGFDKATGRGVFVLLNSGAIKGDDIGEKLLDLIP